MIQIAEELAHELTARALIAAPHEACGMLARPKGDERADLVLIGAENAAESPTDSFLISPKEQLKMLAAIERRGEELVGIWHSHPRGGAEPSERDRVMAEGWPGITWVIVGLGGRRPAIWLGYP